MSDDIDVMFSHNQKRGQYLKNFKPNNPNAGQFTWKNNCTSDKVLEILLWKNEAGREISWWDNMNFNNKNRLGLFREYYMFDGVTATFCGVYAHADSRPGGPFVTCAY
jgi:hypothetical protein